MKNISNVFLLAEYLQFKKPIDPLIREHFNKLVDSQIMFKNFMIIRNLPPINCEGVKKVLLETLE